MKRLFCLLFIAFIPVALIAFEGFQIKDIKVLGNQRISNQTIGSYIKLKSGQYISDDGLDLLVKGLYKTNLFVDVNAYLDQEQNLIVRVQENPIINKIVLKTDEWFDYIKQKLLDNVITLKPLSIFTETKLQTDLMNLATFYRNNGNIGAKVEHELVMLGDNRVDLIFKVNKGKGSKIKSVRFIGNKSFPEDDLIQVVKARSSNIFNKLFLGIDKNINQYLSISIDRLSNFYASKGYIDSYIQPIIEVNDDYNTYVTFLVNEGKQYLLGSSKVSVEDGSYGLDIAEEVSKFFDTGKDKVFNEIEVNNTVEKISKFLNEKGYMFAKVSSEYATNNNIIDINYRISPGEKTYVNKIIIDGNDRTWDQVIRSKVSIAEGDPYNGSEINKSYHRLMGTDFFSAVKINKYKVDNNSVNVNLKVKEKQSTSAILLSGRTETMSWPPVISFRGELREQNLFGSGHEFYCAVEKSKNASAVDLNLIINHINDSDNSLDIGVFHKNSKHLNSDFSNTKSGLSIGSSCRITENLMHSIRYYYKDEDIYYNKGRNTEEVVLDRKGGGSDSLRTQSIKDNIHDRVSAIGYILQYNKLDSFRNPTDGYLLRLKGDTSVFGGNVNFLKSEGSYFLARPILKSISDDIVFRFKMETGYIFSCSDKRLSVGQHFFKGGGEIRGFEVSGIGPRDKEGNSLGGKFYFNATKQIDFPLPKFYEQLGLKGSLFIDYATLCSPDCEGDRCKDMEKDSKLLRISPGFGISVPSPFGVGRLRVDVGFPIVKESYDKLLSPNIRFSIDSGVSS
ncbi:outer membrane protein assembly factor BamA [Wolbachia pipientis]|uniref:Outer membrane protein assembly factor BamA n=1 Tax=Wolbachia pipientis TaxID=955 RepID=A0A1E7QKN3_WOLPI|nr:outer membrane protein assembly factor BamA [Wolbachia pipientis]OEY86779.1 outer membrane protein assembly factor BamA [Wolbachia pipientis]